MFVSFTSVIIGFGRRHNLTLLDNKVKTDQVQLTSTLLDGEFWAGNGGGVEGAGGRRGGRMGW